MYTLEKVDQERRIGYAWYGYWPANLLTKKYPVWLKRVSENESGNFPRDTSYTIYSVYQKLYKDYPFIKIVKLDVPEDIVFNKDLFINRMEIEIFVLIYFFLTQMIILQILQ